VAALGSEGAIWILDATTLKILKYFDSNRPPRAALFENGNLFVTTFKPDVSVGEVLIYADVGNID
jgi:hypothetical protein